MDDSYEDEAFQPYLQLVLWTNWGQQLESHKHLDDSGIDLNDTKSIALLFVQQEAMAIEVKKFMLIELYFNFNKYFKKKKETDCNKQLFKMEKLALRSKNTQIVTNTYTETIRHLEMMEALSLSKHDSLP